MKNKWIIFGFYLLFIFFSLNSFGQSKDLLLSAPKKNSVTSSFANFPWEFPNLQIRELFLDAQELRMIVDNVGDAPKPAKLTRAHVYMFPAQDDCVHEPYSQCQIQECDVIAALTSLASLDPSQPNNYWIEDRLVDCDVFGFLKNHLAQNPRIQVCINSEHTVEETNYDDNCKTTYASALLPNLTLSEGRIEISNVPASDKPWYEDAWDFITDVADGVDFDTSGIPSNIARVTVTNNAQKPATNFKILVYADGNLLEGKISERKITDLLQPGESKKFTIMTPAVHCEWGSASCKTFHAKVFFGNSVFQTLEWNSEDNLTPLEVFWVRDHRGEN